MPNYKRTTLATALLMSFSVAHGHKDDGCKGFLVGLQAGYVSNHWSDINQNAFANSSIIVSNDYSAECDPTWGMLKVNI